MATNGAALEILVIVPVKVELPVHGRLAGAKIVHVKITST
jgi:hypothetical protein